MARSAGPQVAVFGIGRVMRALRQVDVDAPKQMRRAIAADLQPIRAQAAAGMPVGPGPSGTTRENRRPHIRDTLRATVRGNRGVIKSTHPGAGVVNYGGTIAPHGAPIRFSRDREAVYRAVVAHRMAIARRVRATIERTGRKYGL